MFNDNGSASDKHRQQCDRDRCSPPAPQAGKGRRIGAGAQLAVAAVAPTFPVPTWTEGECHSLSELRLSHSQTRPHHYTPPLLWPSGFGGSVVLAFLTPQRKGQSLAAGFILLRARYVVTDGVCWHSVRRTTSRCGRQCVCLVGSWCDRRVLTQNNAALQSLGRSVLRCADGPDYLFIIQPKASV